MPDLVALSDVKDALNETSATHDGEIQDFLDAALAHAQRRGLVVAGEVIQKFWGINSRRVILRHLPVSSVASVVVSSYGTETANYDTGIEADEWTGEAWLTDGTWFRGDLVVTYTVGELPADVKRAVVEDVKGLYERSQSGAALPNYGPAAAEDTFAGVSSMPVTMFPRIDAISTSILGPSLA